MSISNKKISQYWEILSCFHASYKTPQLRVVVVDVSSNASIYVLSLSDTKINSKNSQRKVKIFCKREVMCYNFTMKELKATSPFIYKSQEESLLIENLAQSQLINTEQLLEIKKSYNQKVPYHNFVHALKVAEWVLKLPSHMFDIIEIKSLFIAALFHDAWHTGTSQDLDEFRSLDIAFQGIIDFENKYNYNWIDYWIVRKAIIGTVFKNRALNKDKYALILADLDVGTVWMSFAEFLYFADFPFSIEMNTEIKKWNKDVNYFKFLMSISKDIYITPEVQTMYPWALQNIRKYVEISDELFEKLFIFWNSWDITFKYFEDYFKKACY